MAFLIQVSAGHGKYRKWFNKTNTSLLNYQLHLTSRMQCPETNRSSLLIPEGQQYLFIKGVKRSNLVIIALEL